MSDWLRSSFYSYLPPLKPKICILSVISVVTGKNVHMLSLSRLLSVCLSHRWDPHLAANRGHQSTLGCPPCIPTGISVFRRCTVSSIVSIAHAPLRVGQRVSHCTIHKLLHKSCKAHGHSMYVLFTHEINKIILSVI